MARSGVLVYQPGRSVLHRMDALSKAMWVLVVSLGMYLVVPPLFGMICFGCLIMIAWLLGNMPPLVFLRSSNVIFLLGGLLLIFHSVVQPGRPVMHLGPLSVSDCGLAIGIHYFFTMSSVVIVSLIFTQTTDLRDLMAALTKIGLPYQIAFAVFLMFRFLPLMQDEIETVRAAHAIRGRAARSDWQHRLYLWQRYMFTVLVNGLRKAEQTSVATDCRAFGAARRTELREHRWSRSGILLLGGWLALFIVFMILQRGVEVCAVPLLIK